MPREAEQAAEYRDETPPLDRYIFFWVGLWVVFLGWYVCGLPAGGFCRPGEDAGGRGAPDEGHRTPDGRSAEGESVDETSGMVIAWVSMV